MNRCREKKRGKGRVGEKVDTSNYNKRLNQLPSNCSEYECDIIERGGETMATWNNTHRQRCVPPTYLGVFADYTKNSTVVC